MQIVLSSTILGAFFGTLIAVASLFFGATFSLAGFIYLGTALSAMALSTAAMMLRKRDGDQNGPLAAA
ncbi:hypothetical protein [Tropicimonas sp. S265A]|uniref:hypothetical protein n=1 Tax=Tropicimonas sp. S265A TaxID=3415134 RepID=UPI003C7DC9E8